MRVVQIQSAILLIFLAIEAVSQCCLKFDSTQLYCQSCSAGTHLFRDNCILDIPNCLAYLNGFDCQKCADGFQIVDVSRNGYTSKRCKVTQSVQIISIDPEKAAEVQGYGEIYLISNDYIRNSHPDLIDAKSVSATIKKYTNGTKTIEILYEISTQTQTYSKVVLKFDMESFSFEQISSTVFNKGQLSKQNDKIGQNKSNSTSIQVKPFETQQDNNPNTASNQTIMVNTSIPNSGIPKQIANSKGLYKRTETNTFTLEINTQSLSMDTNYMIITDFIANQLNGYSKLSPKLVYTKFIDKIKQYLLVYDKIDASQWEVLINIDTVSYEVKFIYEHKVQEGKEVSGDRVYAAIVPVANAYKNFNFLIALDNINKQRDSKYRDASVEEVWLSQAINQNKSYFKIIYKLNSKRVEICAWINKITFDFDLEYQRQISINNNIGINTSTKPDTANVSPLENFPIAKNQTNTMTAINDNRTNTTIMIPSLSNKTSSNKIQNSNSASTVLNTTANTLINVNTTNVTSLPAIIKKQPIILMKNVGNQPDLQKELSKNVQGKGEGDSNREKKGESQGESKGHCKGDNKGESKEDCKGNQNKMEIQHKNINSISNINSLLGKPVSSLIQELNQKVMASSSGNSILSQTHAATQKQKPISQLPAAVTLPVQSPVHSPSPFPFPPAYLPGPAQQIWNPPRQSTLTQLPNFFGVISSSTSSSTNNLTLGLPANSAVNSLVEDKFALNVKQYPEILPQVSGYTLLTSDELKKDSNFDKIETMLQANDKQEFKNAKLLAVYIRSLKLSKSYKIYYLTIKNNIMEVTINNDYLKQKNILVSIYTILRSRKW